MAGSRESPDWPRAGRSRSPSCRPERPGRAGAGGGRPPRRVRAGARGTAASGAAYAALDLGTNNCRLLVARPAEGGFRVIDAFSRIVRLGEGVASRGILSETAIRRTLKALEVCAKKMRRAGVTRSRAVATEACRRASNCGEFLERVRRETGIELETISSEEEAQLGLHSCLPLLEEGLPHALLFDIGGGSTEVSWVEIQGTQPRLRAWESLPIGVVSLTERYGGHRVELQDYRAMMAEVAEALGPFDARHGLAGLASAGEMQMLGTSGTVTTLTGVHKNLERYDRAQVDGARLSFDTVDELIRRIAAMSYEERVATPCIGRDRADLVVAGCAILEAICGLWPAGSLRVADRGLREGMLLTLMAGDQAVRAGRPPAPRPAP